jgi:hypothetical protein
MPPHKALPKKNAEWFLRVLSDLLGFLTLDAAVFLKLPLHALTEISKAGCCSTRPYNHNWRMQLRRKQIENLPP